MSYINPFSRVSGLIPERIDMGVDYAGSGPILALGNATVLLSASSNTGWPGGGWVSYTLSDGPYAGKHVYIAENVTPLVQTGQRISAGQPVCTLHDAFPNCETGWASGNNTQPLARLLNQQDPFGDPGGWISAAGASFATLLVSLGCPKAPNWGGQVHGTMPPGYPPIWQPAPTPTGFPLKVGATGPAVHQMQRALIARGAKIADDGNFGPMTEAAVKSWQSHVRRAVTGEISKDDWAFMFPQLSISVGGTWPGATKALQVMLDWHGYHLESRQEGKTGTFGTYTEGAVKQFQRQNGLVGDGVVGPKTWAKL